MQVKSKLARTAMNVMGKNDHQSIQSVYELSVFIDRLGAYLVGFNSYSRLVLNNMNYVFIVSTFFFKDL